MDSAAASDSSGTRSDHTAPLVIRRVPLDSLHVDPANARSHPERSIEAIKASLVRFGAAEPLVVHRPTGRVIGGNGRLVAMRHLGWTHADVVELEISEIQATALSIALNRVGEHSEWSLPALGRLLEGLKAEDALDGIGFDAGEIDELVAGLLDHDASEIVEDEVPQPPDKATSRTGDLWILE